MNLSISKMVVLALAVAVGLTMTPAALGDVIHVKGTADGFFDMNPGVTQLYHLTYTGGTFEGDTTAGALDINLGYFRLPNINDNEATAYDNHSFSTVVRFEIPTVYTVNGVQVEWDILEARLDGRAAPGSNPDTVILDFGPKTKIEYNNDLGYGTFDLRVNDITISDQIAGAQFLTGTIDNVIFTSYIPEPASIILLGSLLLGAGLWRKSRA